MTTSRWFLVGIVLVPVTAVQAGDEPIALQEKFTAGYQYRVNCRFSGTGKLPVPPEKGRPAGQILELSGKSMLEYDERILDVDASGDVRKTLRVFRQVEFQKTLGKDDFRMSIRPAVRRMVLLRERNMQAPFSPDGPLSLAEIEIVRTDVFAPALAGLLPANPVKPGDTWKASETAVTTLTHFEKIDAGAIECRFDEVTTQLGRRVARISVTGGVRGVNEDGTVRDEFDGYYFFDLQSHHLTYLTLKGAHLFLDKDFQESGRQSGTFTLSRQIDVQPPEFAPDALRATNLEANDDNTLLLYDNPDVGVRFEYPRAWKVAGVEGRQVTIDGPNGNGLLLTPLLLKDVPTPAQYLAEARTFIEQQRGKLYGMQPARDLRAEPYLARFALEAEMGGQRLLLDYYILKQRDAGATLMARMLPDAVKGLRPGIERIAKSVVVTK